MKIKVIGPGCVKCRGLDHRVRKAVGELNLEAEVEKVEQITEIMRYGMLKTPALVIDERVVMSGQLPSYSEIKALLQTSKMI